MENLDLNSLRHDDLDKKGHVSEDQLSDSLIWGPDAEGEDSYRAKTDFVKKQVESLLGEKKKSFIVVSLDKKNDYMMRLTNENVDYVKSKKHYLLDFESGDLKVGTEKRNDFKETFYAWFDKSIQDLKQNKATLYEEAKS